MTRVLKWPSELLNAIKIQFHETFCKDHFFKYKSCLKPVQTQLLDYLPTTKFLIFYTTLAFYMNKTWFWTHKTSFWVPKNYFCWFCAPKSWFLNFDTQNCFRQKIYNLHLGIQSKKVIKYFVFLHVRNKDSLYSGRTSTCWMFYWSDSSEWLTITGF